MRATGSIEEKASARADAPATTLAHPAALATIGEKASPSGAMRRERWYRRLLALADAVATMLAVAVAFGLPGGAESRWSFLLLAPFVVLGAKLLGLYERDELIVHKTTLDDVPRLAALSMAAVLAVWIFGDALVPETLTRESDMAMGAVLLLSLLVCRAQRAAGRPAGDRRRSAASLIGGPDTPAPARRGSSTTSPA